MKRFSAFPFLFVLGIGMILSMLLPLRPSYSDYEKRKLAEFPKFSFKSLASGDYFDDITLWFSDTFPFREQITTASDRINSWHGIKAITISGEVSKGDDIPTAPSTTRPSRPSTTTTTKSDREQTTTTTDQSGGVTTSSTTTTTTTTAPPTTTRPTEGRGTDIEGVDTQNLGAILVVGDSGYEYYAYVQEAATRYINIINKAGDLLEGKARVVDMIVPTGIGVVLPEKLRATLNSSDQMAAIEYFCASMNENVLAVNVLHTLRAHNEEYIYFRTDHHWTALGAYYAYEEMLYCMGMQPEDISGYDTAEYEGYLGSFYFSANKPASMAANPDVVKAYFPHDDTDFTYVASDGKTYKGKVVSDATNFKSSYKYLCFVAGDQPYEEIVNLTHTDLPTCVVVKESFGNALIPFLVDHYSRIYVIDYRYYDGALTELCDRVEADDVIFINNISMTREGKRLAELENFVR